MDRPRRSDCTAGQISWLVDHKWEHHTPPTSKGSWECGRQQHHDSMSRALIGLHWLPVDKRIEYKLLLYTCKALHELAPGYLCELVVPYVPRRVLRSAELNLLTVPPGKPGKYGSRSFARASANLWISLRGERAAWLKNSPTLESFKRNLKTFLFWERFSS